MRATRLITERLRVIVARSGENIDASVVMEDWEEVLREMAEAGFNVAELLCDLQTYRADRKRNEATNRHGA